MQPVQLDRWSGQFGRDYLNRNFHKNFSDEHIAQTSDYFRTILSHMKGVNRILEVGCNTGHNFLVWPNLGNFELVGIVKSVPAEFEYTLRPLIKERDLEYNPMLPYKGDVYVDKEQVLRIGITKVIGIELVKDFLISHKDELTSRGYTFRDLFVTPNQIILKQVH